jgi:hypothetical protein
MRTKRILLALGIATGAILLIASRERVLMFLVVAAAVFAPGKLPGCEPRQIHTEATSTDGAWIATSYTDICVQGPFTTVVYDSVEIRGAHEPAPRTPKRAVFAKDSYSSELPPAVAWIAPRILEITMPNRSRVAKQETAFADLSIVYKHVPDDPVDRICWNRWQDVIAHSSGGPIPDLDTFLAGCRGPLAAASR